MLCPELCSQLPAGILIRIVLTIVRLFQKRIRAGSVSFIQALEDILLKCVTVGQILLMIVSA